MVSLPPLVADCSHYQENIDAAALKAAGVVGVVHKCTEIMRAAGPIDEFYETNKAACLAVGLFWGGYLYLDPTDGAKQADFYLDTFKQDGLMAIDVEESGLTLEHVESCVLRLYHRTGIWPMFYTGYYVIQRIGGFKSEVIANCQLWTAEKSKSPVPIPPWTSWSLVQYGYGRIRGKTFDFNYFNGTLDQLKEVWKMTTPTTDIVQKVKLIATDDIPAFIAPGGGLHHWYKAGDIVSVDYSIQTVDNGRTYIETPDDVWILKEQLPVGPDPVPNPPPPVPAPVIRYTTVVLNLRSAASPTAGVLIAMPANAKVTATYPGTNDAYHWVAVSYTSQSTGKTYTGFASSSQGSTVYLSANPK